MLFNVIYLQGITLNDHDEYVNDLKARKEQLDDQLVNLTHNNKSFLLTSSYLLEVATKALQLFQSSKAALKSKLLRFLLSNLVVKDKKLVSNLKAPFDVISECSQNQTWLPIQVSNILTDVNETNETVLTLIYVASSLKKHQHFYRKF